MANDGWGSSSGWGKELNVPAGSEADKAWRGERVSGWDLGVGDKTTVVTGEVSPDSKLYIDGCYESKSFTFNYDGKTHTKDTIVVGDLAVICGQEPFLILHIYTLSSFDKAIPAGTWSVEELVEWSKKVQQSQQSS